MLAMALVSNPKRYHTLFPALWGSEQRSLAELLESLWSHPHTRHAERPGGSYWFKIGE